MTSTATGRRVGRGTSDKAGGAGRAPRTAAQREAAEAARAARITALHEQITEVVAALAADPAWRSMLQVAARLHGYSLNNQLLIAARAARLGFTPTRVAGYGTWKALARPALRTSSTSARPTASRCRTSARRC